MELDLQCPLASCEDQLYDDVLSLFDNEADHMPSCLLSFHSSDFRLSIRRTSISLISRMKISHNLDPFLVYLSVNYVDRFLSKQEILDERPWIARILVIASLSLAAKMTNSNLPFSLADLQREEGFDFGMQPVRQMEIMMLESLQWRMRSVTPFSFLHYFLSLFQIEDSDLALALKRRVSDVIFRIQPILEVLAYKPSVLASASLLCAIQELMPEKFTAYQDTIFSCEYMNQDSLLECLGVMEGILAEEGCVPNVNATTSGSLTLVGVLACQRTNCRSEDTGCSNAGYPKVDSFKRRKLNNLYGHTTLNQMAQNSTMLNF